MSCSSRSSNVLHRFHQLRSTLELVTPPSSEPVGPYEFKIHARAQDVPDEDLLVLKYLLHAREQVETDCELSLLTQTWKLRLDRFPAGPIELRRPPVQSATIEYIDTDGVLQTLSPTLYNVDTASYPGLITPAYAKLWPYTRAEPNSVIVTFVAGWTAANLIPERAKQAIRLLAAYDHGANREADGTEIEGMQTNYRAVIDRLCWAGYR